MVRKMWDGKLTIMIKQDCWDFCAAHAEPIIQMIVHAPWAMLRSCVWRREKPNCWIIRLEKTPRPPIIKFATVIRATLHQTNGSVSASMIWYFLYCLFLMPVSLCRTLSTMSIRSSSPKHLDDSGLSGRNIPMKKDQTQVARPRTRNSSCQFFIGPFVKWDTPKANNPPICICQFAQCAWWNINWPSAVHQTCNTILHLEQTVLPSCTT